MGLNLQAGPSVRMVGRVAALLAGEALGFAMGGTSDCWGVFAVVFAVALVAAWGWGVRHLLPWSLLALGFVLALRTESQLRQVLDANAGVEGPRVPLELRVEGNATPPRPRQQGGWTVEFPAHAGVVPLKVVMPLRRESDPVPKRGEIWRVDGWMSHRAEASRRYNCRMLWARANPEPRRVKPAPAGMDWDQVADELAERAGAGLEWCPELAALNRAILLGRRAELSKERRQMFVDAGTIHVFAISGLHVMVVAWMLGMALERVGLPLRARGLVSVPLIVAYVVLTGSRPSAVRAAIMAVLWLGAPVFGRRPDSLMAWALTAMVVYGISPEWLLDPGCALSFTVMFGIVMWVRWTRQLASPLPPDSRLAKYLGGMGVSLAAWIAGVPLAAVVFGRFTPGGLIANAVVVGCATVMVRCGASALAVSFICLPLAAIVNNISAAFTWLMAFVSQLVAALPFSSFEIEPWGLPSCLMWYAGWLMFFMLLGHFLPRKALVSKKWW